MKKKILTYVLLTICILCYVINISYLLFWKKDHSLETVLSYTLLISFVVFLTIYIKNNKEKFLTINIALISLILYNVILLNSSLNFINISYFKKLPNFSNKSYVEVVKWAKSNNVIVNEEYEYSDITKEYYIINQDIESGTSLHKVKELNVVISSGKNPEKEIGIPDMTGSTIDKVLEFIEENSLSNVKIEYEDNDTVKEDELIKQNVIGSIKRNDEIVFTFSRGDIIIEDEITLENLVNISKLRATAYLNKYMIEYKIEEDYSDEIKKDYVLKQSVAHKEKINRLTTPLTLTISRGKSIKVPNLSKMSLDEISKWAINNKIKLQISKQYDDSIEKDKLISSSVKENDKIGEGEKISLTISKGHITMLDFKDLNSFKSWAIKYNIKYEIEYDFSEDVENGEIIKFSHKKDEVIKNNDTITVTVSNGNSVKVPNFVGMTKKDIETKCKNSDLKCSFQYQNSNKTKNTAIRQSLSSGSNVAKGTSISIIISNGQTSTSTNNNTNTTVPKTDPTPIPTPSQEPTTPTTPEPTCQVQSVTLDYDFVQIFTANISNPSYDTVYNKLKNYFSEKNVKVTIYGDDTSPQKPGYRISGIKPGDTLNTCCPNNCEQYSITISK